MVTGQRARSLIWPDRIGRIEIECRVFGFGTFLANLYVDSNSRAFCTQTRKIDENA